MVASSVYIWIKMTKFINAMRLDLTMTLIVLPVHVDVEEGARYSGRRCA